MILRLAGQNRTRTEEARPAHAVPVWSHQADSIFLRKRLTGLVILLFTSSRNNIGFRACSAARTYFPIIDSSHTREKSRQ